MANRTISPSNLGDEITRQLTLYGSEATKAINLASKEAANELVKLTTASAPVRRGKFAASISSKKVSTKNGCDTYLWYAKPPHHRLTHLLVHGHATRNGGRVGGNSFLHSAWEIVREKYENAVERALRK